jgi:Family of unknown function (DUF6440)
MKQIQKIRTTALVLIALASIALVGCKNDTSPTDRAGRLRLAVDQEMGCEYIYDMGEQDLIPRLGSDNKPRCGAMRSSEEWKRSGFKELQVMTDYGTGCQYVRRTGGGLTPRLNKDGALVCTNKDNQKVQTSGVESNK